MRSLKLIKILDFYDVPEVFIASDVMSTKYMCLRNSFSEEEGFIYIAVQISTDRLDDYISKRVDLRSLFVYPEADNSYFKVTVHAEKISAILHFLRRNGRYPNVPGQKCMQALH